MITSLGVRSISIEIITEKLKSRSHGKYSEIAAKIEELAASGNDGKELPLLIAQLNEACRKSFEELGNSPYNPL